MKIAPNLIKSIPENLGGNGFCVYGIPSPVVQDWISYWNLTTDTQGKFTNIYVPEGVDLAMMLTDPIVYTYLDGFSPNLNKHLHLGHGANLVIGKAIYQMGIAKETVAILGDTLSGDVSKQEALETYNNLCAEFDYPVNHLYFASDMQSAVVDAMLIPGTGDYIGCSVFDLGSDKVVGRKSSGDTSYFYQDVVFARELDAPTLYLTGVEQIPHFKTLNSLFPGVKHIGLGLVLNDGKKMSSRLGNVVFFEDLITQIAAEFSGDRELAYNIVAAQLLRYDLSTEKNISLKQLTNLQESYGLYVSYTRARVVKAGATANTITTFNSVRLQYALVQARHQLAPHLLLKALYTHCGEMNKMYNTVRIQGNPQVLPEFNKRLADLELGMKLLGLFLVDKV